MAMRFLLNLIWFPLVFISKIVRIAFAFFCVLLLLGGYVTLRMPGSSYTGPLPPLTRHEREIQKNLRYDVKVLAGKIGQRNLRHYANLQDAAAYIEHELKAAGYEVEFQKFSVKGKECANIIAEVPGAKFYREIVIASGHYDTMEGTLGADDNASGVAGLLSLARYFSDKKISRTLRFVFFVNSEPPYFQTPQMGSLVYAKHCARKNENIVAVLNLHSIGYYSREKGSQKFPIPLKWFYPQTGNFVNFVGNTASIGLVKEVVGLFRENAKFPSEGITFPDTSRGIGLSDQWAFWQYNYPALMITDTAPYRNPYHHTRKDTPYHLNYDNMARVVAGLEDVLGEMVFVRR